MANDSNPRFDSSSINIEDILSRTTGQFVVVDVNTLEIVGEMGTQRQVSEFQKGLEEKRVQMYYAVIDRDTKQPDYFFDI